MASGRGEEEQNQTDQCIRRFHGLFMEGCVLTARHESLSRTVRASWMGTQCFGLIIQD